MMLASALVMKATMGPQWAVRRGPVLVPFKDRSRRDARVNALRKLGTELRLWFNMPYVNFKS